MKKMLKQEEVTRCHFNFEYIVKNSNNILLKSKLTVKKSE